MNPTNDWLQTYGFTNNTSLVNSNDGGRTPILDAMQNPFPTGINRPTGSSLGALTYAGKSFNWFNPNFILPRSQPVLRGHSSTASAVRPPSTCPTWATAWRTNRPNAPFDINPNYLSCSVIYGAKAPAGFASPAAYCNQTLPNPFQGLAPFIGTSMYTASTISLNQLQRQYPQFTGGTELGLNDGHVWYNSLQVNYSHRMCNGLNLQLNYTLSKQIERYGYLNFYQQPEQYQQGLYYADRPHFFKATVVYPLPFGHGEKLLAGVHGVTDRLVSGWEVASFITEAPEGEPANQSGSLVPLGNPAAGNIHWGAPKVQIYNNCILNEDDTGAIAPLPSSISNGCSATDFSHYGWLQLRSELPPQPGELLPQPERARTGHLHGGRLRRKRHPHH